MFKLSVILPTYNPNLDYLRQTLEALKHQSLPSEQWELVLVDNHSTTDFRQEIDLSWHPAAIIVSEWQQGLTFARLKGFASAQAALIVLVDDDNILESHYLERVIQIFAEHPDLGAIGGRSIPSFDGSPTPWSAEFYGNLALRDLGEKPIIEQWESKYPHAAPIGAGMALRAGALARYISVSKEKEHAVPDRVGDALSSGGDNDIILEVLQAGWKVGYFPALSLRHIIPARRTQKEYLGRLCHDTNKSWIMVLEHHHINPWHMFPAWTAPFRKLRAWFSYKAWRSEVHYIKWRGACGLFEGLIRSNKSPHNGGSGITHL